MKLLVHALLVAAASALSRRQLIAKAPAAAALVAAPTASWASGVSLEEAAK